MAAIFDGRWTRTANRVLLRDQLVNATKSSRLASLYWESIRALGDPDNEARHAIAGHLLRELQDGLPRYLNVPEERGRLGDFFQWLAGTWRKLMRGRAARAANGLWVGETVDGRLGAFLGVLHDKIDEYAAVYGRRRETQRLALGQLDRGFGDVPGSVQKAVVDRWMEIHDVFTNAAHHRLKTSSELEDAVEAFEEMLIDRLAPRTFAKQDAIAALVREAEGRADA